jgi:hypothetical protein
MPVETPCVRICFLDPDTGWCAGCGRTGHEIGAWLAMTPETRRKVMEELPDRLARLAADMAEPARRARGRA